MSNTIINLLQEAGYSNQGTNRETAIRNLNLLLDAGILSIKFVKAEKYNAKDSNWAFWFTGSDGKRYCTPYCITLFGKSYYGDYVQKSKTTKFKHIQHMDGTWEYATNTEYFNNLSLDLTSIMLRVARLISSLKGNGDFMQSQIFAKHGECSCNKCNGNGIIPQFLHYANGVCFDCGGVGVDRNVLKMHIQEAVNMAK